MNLEEILSNWEEAGKVDSLDLTRSSVETAKLHAKYLKQLSLAKLQLKREQLSQKSLLKEKWLYYNGKMSQDEIAKKGWPFDHFDGLKVVKTDMNYYYDSDIDIQKTEEKIAYFKTIVETLQEIVDTIRWRHQTIGNIIKWKQFESGG